ncbi:hypothetical protein D3C73_1083430 [compost metagenome]
MAGQHAVADSADGSTALIMSGPLFQLRAFCALHNGNPLLQLGQINFPDNVALGVGGLGRGGSPRWTGHSVRQWCFFIVMVYIGSFLPLFLPFPQGLTGFHRCFEDLEG